MAYEIILADPPWPYGDPGIRGGTKKHYAPMSLARLRSLPVEEVAASNAHCFMWTTANFVDEGIRLMRHWGFKYKTKIPWVKLSRSRTRPVPLEELLLEMTSFGCGHYTRNCHEDLLFGVRGSKPPVERNVRGIIIEAVREHSRKPAGQYELIRRLSYRPGARALELFARDGETARPAYYDTWGDQVSGSIRLPGCEEAK